MNANKQDLIGQNKIFPRQPEKISGKIIVVGDIHGQYYKITDLWNKLKEKVDDFRERYVIFIGDYMDRGGFVRETMEWLCRLRKTRSKTIFLCGNHDLAFGTFALVLKGYLPDNYNFQKMHEEYPRKEDLWEGPAEIIKQMHLQGRRWVKIYDTRPTFKSYGARFGDRVDLLSKMPESHIKFFEDLPWVVEHEKYIFVHSGLEENKDIKKQLEILHKRDLTIPRVLPIHGRYLQKAPIWFREHNVKLVSGHYHLKDVLISEDRILVDTSGGVKGPISAVMLPEEKIIQSAY